MDINTINAMTADEMRAELIHQYEQGHFTRESDGVVEQPCRCGAERWLSTLSSAAFVAGWREADQMLAEEDAERPHAPGVLRRMTMLFRKALGVRMPGVCKASAK